MISDGRALQFMIPGTQVFPNSSRGHKFEKMGFSGGPTCTLGPPKIKIALTVTCFANVISFSRKEPWKNDKDVLLNQKKKSRKLLFSKMTLLAHFEQFQRELTPVKSFPGCKAFLQILSKITREN